MKLVLDGIKKDFKQHEVLRGCNYTFEEGKIYGLLGKNGAGKTTLFNILYNEINLDSGQYYIELDNGEERPVTTQDIGMVFAENYLPDFLTGFEFVKFYLDINGHDTAKDPEDYLKMVDIPENQYFNLINSYSSGMKSKLSMLTVIISQPKIILLDEPLTAVDVLSGIELKKILNNLKENAILILSTHMLQLAEELCDELILLKDGQLASLDHFNTEEEFEVQLVRALSDEQVDAEGPNHEQANLIADQTNKEVGEYLD